MLKRGQYYLDQTREEKVVVFQKPHFLSILPQIIFTGVFFIIVFLLIINFVIFPNNLVSSQIPSVEVKVAFIAVLGIFLLLIIWYFTQTWIMYYFNILVLTSDHLVDIRQVGYFNRKISEQSLLRVQDVSSRMEGILQTWVHYGTVFVETAGESPNFVMPNMPNPFQLANRIMEQHEELLEKEGYSAEDLAEAEGILKKKNSKIFPETRPSLDKSWTEIKSAERAEESWQRSPKDKTRQQGNLEEGEDVEF